MKHRSALVTLPAAAILAAFLWPVIVGRETWFLRDLFNYHLTVKVVQARAMRAGFLPLIDPFRAGGQSLVGNLNNVALYPDNVLYLWAPATWALSAHLWLHLLLAPLAVYWLARVWGLAREAAWAGGFCYALSGFFLSQLNLYNLTAGAALTPALAAACLVAVGESRRARHAAVGAGVVWALLLLGGDPIVAALGFVVAGSAAVFGARGTPRRWARLGVALALGTLVAAPQLVELARILGSSYRGSLGLSAESRLIASWDPRTVVEMLVPLFFGPPDMRYWGEVALRGGRPLFFSLYPGLLAAALVLGSGRPRTRVARWSWSLVLGGGFLALGGWNPLLFYLYRLPQADALRYPIKAWLLVAVGASVLAASGFDRAVLQGSRRALLRALAVLGVAALAAWAGLLWCDSTVVERLRAEIGHSFAEPFAAEQVARWRASLLISAGVVVVAAGLAWVAPRAPRLAGSGLIAAHVASQLLLLGPLLETDRAAAYSAPPPALAFIEPNERVANGCVLSFGCDLGFLGSYPGPEMWWIERRGWIELFPFVGARYGLRYAYNTSPEGLDTTLAFAGNRAFRELDDAGALRLLAASAVDVVLLDRPVAAEARHLARLRARLPSIAGELWIYEIRDPAADVRLAGRVRQGDMRRVLLELLAPAFDPGRDVFIPGRRDAVAFGAGGDVTVRAESWERLRVETSSRDAGMLVLGRAWLPLYLATVDGEKAATLQANMGQLAVPVPAGAHEVEVWIDRRPFRAALGASIAGGLGLVALALAGPARRAPGSPACQTPDPGSESEVAAAGIGSS